MTGNLDDAGSNDDAVVQFGRSAVTPNPKAGIEAPVAGNADYVPKTQQKENAMNFILAARATFCAVCLSLPLSAAAAVSMPKEGRLEFNFCFAGTSQHSEVSPQLAAGSFEGLAALHTTPPGGPFDLQGARCMGTYTFIDGKHLGTGYCVHVDPDGDKWLQKWEAGADFSGTWTAVGGSGKFAGMQASGAFKPIGFVAPALPNSAQHCNRNTGTYKLK